MSYVKRNLIIIIPLSKSDFLIDTLKYTENIRPKYFICSQTKKKIKNKTFCDMPFHGNKKSFFERLKAIFYFFIGMFDYILEILIGEFSCASFKFLCPVEFKIVLFSD